MRIVSPSHNIEWMTENPLQAIERAGRICYKSEARITEDSAPLFIKKIIKSGHHPVLEHACMSVRFITDRGVSHELVRHRLASFSQESTRYCNYNSARFDSELTFVRPSFWAKGSPQFMLWQGLCGQAQQRYLNMISTGASPQEARSILPSSLKTELVMTTNFREWRHVFQLRTTKAAHPQMRQLMRPLLKEVREKVPVIFDDVGCSNIVLSFV